MRELSEETIKEIAGHYEAIIRLLGEDITREGLLKTPMRAAKAMAYVTRGYRQDADEIINEAIFTHEGSKMVLVKDIEFYSLCEHHILPFLAKYPSDISRTERQSDSANWLAWLIFMPVDCRFRSG